MPNSTSFPKYLQRCSNETVDEKGPWLGPASRSSRLDRSSPKLHPWFEKRFRTPLRSESPCRMQFTPRELLKIPKPSALGYDIYESRRAPFVGLGGSAGPQRHPAGTVKKQQAKHGTVLVPPRVASGRHSGYLMQWIDTSTLFGPSPGIPLHTHTTMVDERGKINVFVFGLIILSTPSHLSIIFRTGRSNNPAPMPRARHPAQNLPGLRPPARAKFPNRDKSW